MASKAVRISDDAGSTFYTFPGNQGQLNDEVGRIDDTIFGAVFGSNQPGMIASGVQANGFFKGFAGYVAKLRKSGSPTSFTDEAFTLVSGKTYRITDATKNMWNRAGSFTFKDNAVAVSANNIESIDYLHGRVTFVSGYTPTTPITGSGSYLPITTMAGANQFTLNMQANARDISTFETAQANDGIRSYDYGLKTVSLDVSGIYSAGAALRAALIARSEVICEINPDGSALAVARGIFKRSTRGQQGNVGDNEVESITFDLFVPDQADVVTPFSWVFNTGHTLNTAIKKAIEGWQSAAARKISYLPDGVNGWKGDAIITDISLSGGLDQMNEFNISGQFTGALVAHP